MNFSWHIFINLGIISTALLFATVLRHKIPFLQKFFIPNALTAGFLLLPLYNFVFPKVGLTSIQLGQMTYHFLGLSFIALALRTSKKSQTYSHKMMALPTAMAIITQMVVQCLVGLGLTALFIKTLFPDLFHSFGFLLPLGFAQGPGQAYSIGEGWRVYGVTEAGNLGLTFAAIGFLLCSFGGIFLINHGLKKGWISDRELKNMKEKEVRTGIKLPGTPRPTGARLTTDTEAIDSLTFHLALVLATYFLSWLLLTLLNYLLGFAGQAGRELGTNLWGINFIFAVFMGLLVKLGISKTRVQYTVDNLTLNRISGACVDVMVTSAIAGISLVAIRSFWIPLIITAVTGAVITYFGTIWFCSRIFPNNRFLRTLLIFGCSTGTLSTGLALLRVVDPDFESPVAIDYTYASGLTFVFMIPLILAINLPLKTYVTGDPKWFWITVGICASYLAVTMTVFALIARKRVKMNPGKLWYTRPHKKTTA